MPDDMSHEDPTDRIRRRAYAIWEREGRPEGREADHWKQASEELAIEDNIGQTLAPNPSRGPDDAAPGTEPVEPLGPAEAQGESLGPTAQGEEQPIPKQRPARRRTKSPTEAG